MDIIYRNKTLERVLIFTNFAVTTVVVIAALAQLGFYRPLLPEKTMYVIFIAAVILFIIEKILRFFNARFKKDFFHFFWFEILFVIISLFIYYTAGLLWFLSTYVLLQIITKVCRTVINLAASGRSPALTFVGSFVVIIFIGAILLMLPKSHNTPSLSFIDALFTSTSATCVTGLVVKDTGTDFTFIGHIIIICLIQLGGLGIIIFGAVFSLMLGQALSFRQTAAMQDILSEQTAGMIAHFIGFIFIFTFTVEIIGSLLVYNMWHNHPVPPQIQSLWFCSIFHSISAFCNAGFGLYPNSLMSFSTNWQIYAVICPLVILGGLGFAVLHNLFDLYWQKFTRFFSFRKLRHLSVPPERMQLQTKIVIVMNLILIIAGTAFLLIIQNNTGKENIELTDAFFQAVIARTAGFNSIDISILSDPARFLMIILMLIGGSPASAAGGIKTVTFAVIIVTIYSAIRKRSEVEIFKRSIPLQIVGKAITVFFMFLFFSVTSSTLLSITERHSGIEFSAIMFETASALGTVGLSCGITPSLTTAGKIIIIITMLVGRLGPLTLLTLLTFNIRPARVNYPMQPVVVG